MHAMPENEADADAEVDVPAACESGISWKRTIAVDVDDDDDDDAPAFLTAEISTGERSTEESDPTNLESRSESSSFSAKLIVTSSAFAALNASATLALSSETLSLAWLFTTSSLLADDDDEDESEDSDIVTLFVNVLKSQISCVRVTIKV